MNICKHCGERLTMSVYNANKTLKSCPGCSSKNGSYHIFHEYPKDFGVTDKRSSASSPEGAQSYCTKCRGNNPPGSGILCNEV